MSSRCGYICSLYSSTVLDINGCVLPDGHKGPHEFLNNRDGQRYQWEYDLDEDQDVYWRKPDLKCPVCDGYGGLAFVGSTGPGIPCGRCNGTGKAS